MVGYASVPIVGGFSRKLEGLRLPCALEATRLTAFSIRVRKGAGVCGCVSSEQVLSLYISRPDSHRQTNQDRPGRR